MNKKQILLAIKNSTNDYERERLQQLLHYMTVEGVDTTSVCRERTHKRPRTDRKQQRNNKRQ